MTEAISVPRLDLTGRVALITGASSGFGAHWSRLLASAGAKVVLAARRLERLDVLRREIEQAGGSAHAVALDVRDDAATSAAYDEAERIFGTVDTVIANAGVASGLRAIDTSGDDFDRVLSTNLRGVFLTVREGARRLIEAGSASNGNGRIVIVSSITARKFYPGAAAYSASKAAAAHLGKVLAGEWSRKGINVNVLLPGYCLTEMADERYWNSLHGEQLTATFPRRQLCAIEAMDAPLLFFCSDLSAQVTGAELVIDDGQSL